MILTVLFGDAPGAFCFLIMSTTEICQRAEILP